MGELGLKLKKKSAIILLIINNFIVFLSKCIFTGIVEKNNLSFGTALFYHYNTFFQLLNAILLLRIFYDVKLNTRTIKMVATICKHVFPIYLIHEHQISRYLLWSTGILEILKTTNDFVFVAIIVGGSVSIFLLGLLIDICIDKICYWIDKLPPFIGLQTFLTKKCNKWIDK